MSRERIPLAQDIETRDGTLTIDAKMVNGYPETIEQNITVGIKRPGISTVLVLPYKIGQCILNFDGNFYAVLQNTFYSINGSTYTQIGQLTSGGVLTSEFKQCYYTQTLMTERFT
jgi:hypothetical protein